MGVNQMRFGIAVPRAFTGYKLAQTDPAFARIKLDIMFKFVKSSVKTSMRVAGGTAKGRRLVGTISPEARPTTERVRAAIFNIINTDLYHGGRVLDLYAGSGSLGIEAISRGAAWADFVEQDRRQCGVIQSNLDNSGFGDQGSVHCALVEASLANLSGPYQLVLLDPPYRMLTLGEVLEKIGSVQGLVDQHGMVVAGHSRHLTLLADYGPLRLVSNRLYGDNLVDFYQLEIATGD